MDYIEKAKLLGQNVDELTKKGTLTSEVTIKSLDDFKKVFASNISDENRKNFSVANFAIAEPLMRNLTEHVYGERELTEEDNAFAEKLFPIRATVTSGHDITISTDKVYGPTAAPVYINAGTLTFDGGSITAVATVLNISADTLLINKSGSKPYTVGILGQTGNAGYTGQPIPLYSAPAPHGQDVSPPSPGVCTGAPNGGIGKNGSKGLSGNHGGSGQEGVTNAPAVFDIRNFSDSSVIPFTVFTQSGGGGVGAAGGQGQGGQAGGRGGNGCDSGCEGTDGGQGGNGGDGGSGGSGGAGGNGVAGTHILIKFPSAHKSMLVTLVKPASPGAGGTGGSGGNYGPAGVGGKGGKHSTNGSAGSPGNIGIMGVNGAPGAKVGAPGNITTHYT